MIGARFSLYPMRDTFVPVILEAVRDLEEFGVEAQVDDVSTCLLGEEPNIWEALRVAFGRAASSGSHVVLTATFSAGCPGEPDADCCVPRAYTGPSGGEEGWSPEAYHLGERVAAQFALYPLGVADYMETIYGEIEHARRSSLRVVGRHFCTHLYGRGDEIFQVLREAFGNARTRGTHIVMTATIAANSPTLSEAKVTETEDQAR